MLATTFSCPQCGALLKIAAPLPAGKKIRCPKCTGIFAPPADTAGPTPSVRTVYPDPEPFPETRSETGRDYSDPAPSAHIQPYSDTPADDMDRMARPGRRVAIDDLDVRASSIRRAPGKRKGALVGFILGGLLLTLGALAFAAWVWPGFWKRGTPIKGEGTEELWTFAPRDSNLFMGFELQVFEKLELLRPEDVEKIKQTFERMQNIPMAGETDLADSAKFFMAAKIPTDGGLNRLAIVYVFKTKKPYDPEKIRQVFQGGDFQQLNGKKYYELKAVGGNPMPDNFRQLGLQAFVCMPSDRVVVLAFAPPGQLSEILHDSGAQPRLSQETQTFLRRVDKSGFWMAFSTQGALGKQLQQIPVPPDPKLARLVTPLRQATGFLFNVDYLNNDKLRLAVGVVCNGERGAKEVAGALRDFWNSKNTQDDMKRTRQMLLEKPTLLATFDEFQSSLDFISDGPVALAEAEFSVQVVRGVAKDVLEEILRMVRNRVVPFGR
jgi:hypothetical protein